jgi:hypothetical protein
VRIEYHRGHWKNPMMDAEVEEKFRSLAKKQLRPTQADDLLWQLWAQACRKWARDYRSEASLIAAAGVSGLQCGEARCRLTSGATKDVYGSAQ